jgi:two-component system response regulator FlrC
VHLPQKLMAEEGKVDEVLNECPPNLQKAVKSNEQQLILAAIQTTDTRIKAARKLGISPRTLRYKLARLKTEMPELALAY